MLKLILGRAGAGKTTAVLKRLCQAGQMRQQVLMVPEQQSHEAERALMPMGGTGPLSGLRSCPLADYAAVSFRPLAAWGSGSWTGAGVFCLCTGPQ